MPSRANRPESFRTHIPEHGRIQPLDEERQRFPLMRLASLCRNLRALPNREDQRTSLHDVNTLLVGKS